MWYLLLFLIPFSYVGFDVDHLIKIPLIFFLVTLTTKLNHFNFGLQILPITGMRSRDSDKDIFLNLSMVTNLVNVLLFFVTPPTISSSAHCINSVAKPLQPPFSSDFTSGAYKNNYKTQNE